MKTARIGPALVAALTTAGSLTGMLASSPPAHAAACIAVTTTADSGTGSLRQAIIDANAAAGADTICFSIPVSGAHTIAPVTALPTITDPVTIDGTTQSGFTATPVIELSGANIAGVANGLDFQAGSAASTVLALVVNRFGGIGVNFASINGKIAGSYVGLDQTGAVAFGNGTGVKVATGVTGAAIAPTDPLGGNVISGNGVGVDLSGDTNVVAGNRIGTNAAGGAPVGNTIAGISVTGDSNTIGGSTGSNQISGNSAANAVGVVVSGSAASTLVQGNTVGLNAGGTVALPNDTGVSVTGGSGTSIGGTDPSDTNMISGNSHAGVSVSGGTGLLLAGNRIGTSADGQSAVGNGEGVRVSTDTVTVGGSAGSFTNVISGNTGPGVHLAGTGANAVHVVGNLIGTKPVSGPGSPAPLGNHTGVLVDGGAHDNVIGGTGGNDGNTIAAANGAPTEAYGVILAGDGNMVEGNGIGSDSNSATNLGNATGGVLISGSNNTIGGTLAASRNMISGNGAGSGGVGGIRIQGASTTPTGNVIAGNRIGTTSNGNGALANTGAGVSIVAPAAVNTIGGTDPGASNQISGNTGDGVSASGVNGTIIEGDLIGTDAAGTGSVANGGAGVRLDNANTSTVGGVVAGAANTIAHNTGIGVVVSGSSVSDTISGNSIDANGGLGIDLGPAGITLNDDKDVDAGANGLQNYPVITSATENGTGDDTINGTLNSTPAKSFTIELFASTTKDPSGNGEGATYLGTVNPAATDGSGNTSFSAPFPGGNLAGKWITATATRNDTGDTSEFSTAVQVSGPADHFSVVTPPFAAAGSSFTFTVTALDAGGRVANDYAGTVTFSSTDGSATLPGDYTFTGGDAGSHTFSATYATPGNQTITATDNVTASINGTSNSTAVTPVGSVATHLDVSAPPAATAGTPISFTVTALDALNQVVTGYTNTVQFSSTDGSATLPGNYSFVAGDHGVHTFGATLRTSGSKTITATQTPLTAVTGTSGAIVVAPAPANHFTDDATGTATAGTPFTLNVTARDQFGNIATDYSGTVHFTSSDAFASLPDDYTFTTGGGADNGVHGFSVTLNTAPTRTLTYQDVGHPSMKVTHTYTITPGPAVNLVVDGPASATAGSAVSITVTAVDSHGNTATGYAGTVHFTSSDGAATLPANYTFTGAGAGKDNGVHTFSVTFKTAGSQTVTATDTITSSITGSHGLLVNPGAATHYTVTAPSTSVSGSPFGITVTALDANNNVATGYTGRAHFTSSDGAATLPGDYTFETGDHGAHTFPDGVTLRTVGTKTVTATDTVTASITGQASVDVTPAAGEHLVVSAPATATSGSSISVTVTATTSGGATDTGYTGTVHFTSSDGAATLPADYAFVGGDAGTKTFSVTLKTAGNQTVTATDTSNSSITGTSGTIAVSPGPASSITVVAPTSASAGTPFTFSITIKDTSGNTVTSYGGTVHFTSSDGAAVKPADYPFVAGDNGAHTFTNGATLFTAGPQTITATDTVTGSITGTSGPIAVTAPGPATHFVVVAPASATQAAPVSVSVTARDSNDNVATAYSGTAHFTSTDGAATLPADYAFTGGDAGAHTFSVTFNTVGSQTVTATDTSTAITGTSNAVTVAAAGGGGGGGGGPTLDPMKRLSGDDRILTAIAVSKDSFPAAGTANAVVLSRSDAFADALAGTPLAIAKNAPLLLTAPGGAIDARTFGEIQRALTPGKTVYILGGPSAVDPSVATALQSAGYTVVRYQGNNRYSTAAAVAHDGLNDPPTQFLATGTDFADALAGGAAAANVPGGAVILLTNGSTMAPETSTYMAAHPAVAKFALGGPAAAADPTATPIVGSDRFDTSVKVATTFFNHPVVVGIAYGFNFPDALAGGTHIGAKHGPLLLTDTNALPAKVSTYLTNEKTSINSGYGYGGVAVISNATLTAAQTAYT
ncbi:MAG: hypothetical protein JWO37_2887 [Acidimicrobiales bacterium]|jgi:putative cell wall-binding protein|nr:hypothetical protein [Acidimicrobiales bacterium]